MTYSDVVGAAAPVACRWTTAAPRDAVFRDGRRLAGLGIVGTAADLLFLRATRQRLLSGAVITAPVLRERNSGRHS